MPIYSGIIFDLDGVLVHTDHYHFLAWKQLADRLSIPFDEKINRRLLGVSRMDSLEIILEQGPIAYSPAEKEALAAEKNETYRRFLQGMSPADVAPEVRHALAALRTAGWKLAVGSSSRNAALILEKTALTGAFDAIVDGNAITHAKPHPEVFLHAAAALGLSPKSCLVIEDAEAGLRAAIAGGMMPIAIGPAAESPIAGCSVRSLAELETLLPSCPFLSVQA